MEKENIIQLGHLKEGDIGTMVPGISTKELFARISLEIEELGGEILNKQPAIIGPDWLVLFSSFPDETEFAFVFAVHNVEKETFLTFSDTDIFCPEILRDMANAMLSAKKMLRTKRVS